MKIDYRVIDDQVTFTARCPAGCGRDIEMTETRYKPPAGNVRSNTYLDTLREYAPTYDTPCICEVDE